MINSSRNKTNLKISKDIIQNNHASINNPKIIIRNNKINSKNNTNSLSNISTINSSRTKDDNKKTITKSFHKKSTSDVPILKKYNNKKDIQTIEVLNNDKDNVQEKLEICIKSTHDENVDIKNFNNQEYDNLIKTIQILKTIIQYQKETLNDKNHLLYKLKASNDELKTNYNIKLESILRENDNLKKNIIQILYQVRIYEEQEIMREKDINTYINYLLEENKYLRYINQNVIKVNDIEKELNNKANHKRSRTFYNFTNSDDRKDKKSHDLFSLTINEIKENSTIQKIYNNTRQTNKVNINYIPRSNKQPLFYINQKLTN